MPEKKRNVYLGTRVEDVGKKGLDRLSEVIRIVRAILDDYRGGIINKTLAKRRLSLLKLVVLRDRDFRDPTKRQRAINIIEKGFKDLEKIDMEEDAE